MAHARPLAGEAAAERRQREAARRLPPRGSAGRSFWRRGSPVAVRPSSPAVPARLPSSPRCAGGRSVRGACNQALRAHPGELQHGRVKPVAQGEREVAATAPAVGEGQDLVPPAAEDRARPACARHHRHPVPGTERPGQGTPQDVDPAQRLGQQPARVGRRDQGEARSPRRLPRPGSCQRTRWPKRTSRPPGPSAAAPPARPRRSGRARRARHSAGRRPRPPRRRPPPSRPPGPGPERSRMTSAPGAPWRLDRRRPRPPRGDGPAGRADHPEHPRESGRRAVRECLVERANRPVRRPPVAHAYASTLVATWPTRSDARATFVAGPVQVDEQHEALAWPVLQDLGQLQPILRHHRDLIELAGHPAGPQRAARRPAPRRLRWPPRPGSPRPARLRTGQPCRSRRRSGRDRPDPVDRQDPVECLLKASRHASSPKQFNIDIIDIN